MTRTHDLLITKKQAALDGLYDPAQGLFVSGAERQISWASQIWMVPGGVCGGDVLRRVENAKAVTMVTALSLSPLCAGSS